MSQHRRLAAGWTRHARLKAAGAFIALAAVGAIAAPAAQADTSELATSSPAGLIQSTGNLYWTANSHGANSDYIGTVYRASKSNIPGQETVLYQEQSATPLNFGEIKWAEVGGQGQDARPRHHLPERGT